MTTLAATTRQAPQGMPLRVVIETISYINDLVGRAGESHAEFVEPATPTDTIRTVLRRFSERHAKLKDTLWDPANTAEIGPHIEVIVNDAILDIHHTLDSPVHDGDRIILTGQYIGG